MQLEHFKNTNLTRFGPVVSHDDAPSRRLVYLGDVINRWIARYSVPLLRVSLGIVFLLFGVLKFIPGGSPAETIAGQTMQALSFGIVPTGIGICLVAIMETMIGLCLTSGKCMRVGLVLLGLAMIGVLSPLVLFPRSLFPEIYAPTLVGQYVLKDIVLLAAGLVVTAHYRGSRMSMPNRPRES